MTKRAGRDLTRRERQIMDVIYRLGEATVAEVREGIPDAPSYSAVRAMMRVLEEKGHVTHEQDGPRYVYSATTSREEASRSALRKMVETFFEDSTEKAAAALLDLGAGEMSEEELDRLEAKIAEAREEGR